MSNAQPKGAAGPVIAGHLAGTRDALSGMIADSALIDAAAHMAEAWIAVFDAGGKLLLCGDGGGLALGAGVVQRLVARGGDKAALPALSLSADGVLLAAIASDPDPAQVFARQVAALARSGDAVLALCPATPSTAVAEALKSARATGATPLAITGPEGQALAPLCNQLMTIPTLPGATADMMGLLLSALCTTVEARLFPPRRR